MTLDAASVLLDGPWNHRLVSANGARFHVAELGDGPMVLLMHGFPQFWYTWRHQMAAIADAGWRAVAMDLRGYGGDDKPPRGYDTYTGAEDAASLIRSLGEDERRRRRPGSRRVIAWSMPYLQPDVVRAVGSLSMPHPRVMRQRVGRDRRQRQASRYLVGLQRPFVPEREMTKATPTSRSSCGPGPRRSATTRPTEDAGATATRWRCPSWPTPPRSTTAGSVAPRSAPTGRCSAAASADDGHARRCSSCTAPRPVRPGRQPRGLADYVSGRYAFQLVTGPATSSPRRRRPRPALGDRRLARHRRLTGRHVRHVLHNPDMSE